MRFDIATLQFALRPQVADQAVDPRACWTAFTNLPCGVFVLLQERTVREIRTLRVMRRGLETGSSYRLPRPSSTLPGPARIRFRQRRTGSKTWRAPEQESGDTGHRGLTAPYAMTARRKRLTVLKDRFAAAAMGARNRHEITRVDAFPLREPISRRAYTLVRIRTKSGLAGHGECSMVSRADLEHARQVLIGRAATSYAGSVVGSPIHPAAIAAMLDIIGQACAAPLFRVLGGPTRNKVRVMTSLDGSAGAELEASLSSGLKAGFRAFQVPAPAPGARNQGQAYVRSVRARLKALRAPARDNVDFVLDAAGRLSPGDAASLAAALEEFHLLWFDEPCPLSDLPRVRRIAETTVTPLGFGRSVNQPHSFQDCCARGFWMLHARMFCERAWWIFAESRPWQRRITWPWRRTKREGLLPPPQPFTWLPASLTFSSSIFPCPVRRRTSRCGASYYRIR